MEKKKYDTGIILLYLLGKEQYLPKEFRRSIPYSTISTWRKTDYTSYEGHQFRFLFDEDWDSIGERQVRQRLERELKSIAKTWLLIRDAWQTSVQKGREDHVFQRRILEAVAHLRTVYGLAKALKWLGLSRALYQQWNSRALNLCPISKNLLCLKRHPTQLRREELQKMKNLLTASLYQRWPISSIAALGLRKNKVVVSLRSWYKYARLMDLAHPPLKANRKLVGLKAARPNEYLHIDTTYYSLSTGKKVCITAVMDNYSRMVLGFELGENLSFDLIKGAVQNALLTISTHPDQSGSYLVADGGRENHNRNIDGFIAALSGYKLTKIKALKDIQFSNSPVEAIHRILKGRYLRNRKFQSLDELRTCLTEAVFDYNEQRPHGHHAPKTPKEVYFNLPLNFDIDKRMKTAAAQRMLKNKSASCTACTHLNPCPTKTLFPCTSRTLHS